jgi:hypothetical protein
MLHANLKNAASHDITILTQNSLFNKAAGVTEYDCEQRATGEMGDDQGELKPFRPSLLAEGWPFIFVEPRCNLTGISTGHFPPSSALDRTNSGPK